MICKNCNRNNPDDARVCGYCGVPLQPSYFARPDEKTQSAGAYYPNPGYKQMPGVNNGNNNKGNIKIFLIAAIAVAVAALLIFTLLVVSILNNRNDNKDSESGVSSFVSDNTGSTESTTVKDVEVKESLNNITYDSGIISTDELNNLQSLLEKKSASFGHTVKLCVKKSAGGAQKFADGNCSKTAGKDGTLIVVDAKTKKAGISASGKSRELVSDKVKKKVVSNTSADFSTGNYSDGVKSMLEAIPEKSSETKAYGFDVVSGAKQVVYVKKNSGSTSAKLTLVDYSGVRPDVKLECDGYVGDEGITDSPSEDKSATPKGTFKLGMVLTTNSISTKMNIEHVNVNDVWVTDPDSSYYNTKQGGPAYRPGYWTSADNIYNNFATGKFYACILIEHNGDGYTKGEYNKGSGIYITGKSSELSKSWGDVNISVSDMAKLLGILDSGLNPYVAVS